VVRVARDRARTRTIPSDFHAKSGRGGFSSPPYAMRAVAWISTEKHQEVDSKRARPRARPRSLYAIYTTFSQCVLQWVFVTGPLLVSFCVSARDLKRN